MLRWVRAFAVCLLFATAGGALASEVKPYAREDMASDAVRLTETLRIEAGKIGAQTAGKTPDDLRKAASAAALAGKFDAAQKLAAAAVAAAPKDPANWLAYAGVAIRADDAKADGRWELVTRGATAAYAAYQHSATPDAQALALAALGDLLARHEAWRARARRPERPRSTGATMSTCARSTRPCARSTASASSTTRSTTKSSVAARLLQFLRSAARARRISRPMSRCPARRTRRSPTEDQQLCVEGLKHGERYAIVLRQGLPSAVGEVAAEVGRL